MDTSIVKVTPYNEAAEQSVLGSMLLDRDCVGSVMQFVQSAGFYDPRNKEIFEAVLDLFNIDKPIDVITLAEQLKRRGTFDKIGGEMYLVEIANAVPTSANVRHYAKIVTDYATRRRLIETANEISSLAYEGEEATEKIIDLSEQKIFDISQNRDLSGFTPIRDILSVNFAHLSEQAASKEKITGVPTGFGRLDDILSGLNKSNLILVAARPAMGKTSFALNIAQHAALKKNSKVAIFSLEMSKEEIVNRIWFSEAMIESSKIKEGKMQPNDWEQLTTALSILSKAPIYIDDTAATSVMEMRAKCRRLASEHGLDLIIVDHIQLMQASRRTDNRQQEISEISRSLKMLAKDMQIPVVALSQLSRASESRTDKRPLLSDLRESGAIEQDADIVMMLYRDEYYHPEDSEFPGEAEVIIAKHRSGETGRIRLKWQGEFTRFVSIDNEHREG